VCRLDRKKGPKSLRRHEPTICHCTAAWQRRPVYDNYVTWMAPTFGARMALRFSRHDSADATRTFRHN
jgi:hypothetical protein